MSQWNRRAYFLARAVASRDMAQRAANPGIARVHAEFAAHYDLMAEHREQVDERELTAAQAT